MVKIHCCQRCDKSGCAIEFPFLGQLRQRSSASYRFQFSRRLARCDTVPLCNRELAT
jgi:hypothetical protein